MVWFGVMVLLTLHLKVNCGLGMNLTSCLGFGVTLLTCVVWPFLVAFCEQCALPIRFLSCRSGFACFGFERFHMLSPATSALPGFDHRSFGFDILSRPGMQLGISFHMGLFRYFRGFCKFLLHKFGYFHVIIEVLSAITTACYLHLYHRWCSSDRHLRFQQWDQPHVLDRWCVGLACCFLLWLVRGAFAYQFRCCTSLVISGDFTFSDRKSFRRSWPANKKFGQFRIRHLRFVQCLIIASFLHSGEASNPGPKSSSRGTSDRTWSLGAFNPSGLCGKHQVISSYLDTCDIWAVSETHLTSRGLQSFRKNLQLSGDFQFCVGGAPVPLRPHSDRIGEWSGVGMLSKCPTRRLPVQWPSHTFDTSRILLTTSLCSDLWVTGAVLYGEPQGTTHPEAFQNTDDLAHLLFTQLVSVGGLRFYAGDFNFEKGSLHIFNTLEAAGFRDLQDIAWERWGKVPEKTCKLSTRKDYCYISPELQAFLVDVRLDQTVWADHATIQGFFRGGSSSFVTHHWRIPSKVVWPKDFDCSIPTTWNQNIDSPDVAYTNLWTHVEHTASLVKVREGKLPLPARCRGRGQTHEVTLRRGSFGSRPTKPGRHGDVQPTFIGTSCQHAHWFKQLRRLQSYCRYRKVNPSDSETVHGASLWSSILRARGFPAGFVNWWKFEGAKVHQAPDILPLFPPSAAIALTIYESFLIDVRRIEQTLQAQQKKFAADRRKEMAHLVFQDIKRAAPDRVDVLLKVTSGTVTEIDLDNAFLTVQTDSPLVLDRPIYIDGHEVDVIHVQDQVVCVTSTEGVKIGGEVRQSQFCGAAEDMFQAFALEWKARWDRHKDVPSQWSQICAFIRDHFTARPCVMPRLNAQAIRGEIMKKKPRSASGLDGVSLADLKSMPDSILSAHCQLFQHAESHGRWPSQLVTGKVASLAKVSCPDSVQSYRPITVLSHGYRLWSGLRAKFLLAHLDAFCPAFLFGNRPHCQASQVWTHLAWSIETSFVADSPIGGIIADVEKAFNHLPREVVFQAAVALGLPQDLLIAWSSALGQLTRRFQIREHTGPALDSCTGFPEGDALSCLAMMLMDFIFHLWFERSFPLCQPISYVDDLQLLAMVPSQVPALFDHLLSFAKQVDLTIDQKKTFVWSNIAFHRAEYRKHHLIVRHSTRGLGAQLQFTRKHSTAVLSARLKDLEPLWAKLRLSPSPYNIKVLAIKQAAWTRGLHGVAASNVSDSTFTTLRTHAMRGLAAEGAGCSPVVHLGMIEHPSLDPQCWSILDTFRVVREASSAETLGPLFAEALSPETRLPSYSMTSLLVNRIHTLGWTVGHGVQVSDNFSTFSLFDISYPELVLRVGWAWNQVVADAVFHRKTFHGLCDCDPAATRKFLLSLDLCDQGLFKKALNGAHFTQDAICHWSSTGTTCCEFCGETDSRFSAPSVLGMSHFR